MKFEYKIPEIAISWFEHENIVTGSGGNTNSSDGADQAREYIEANNINIIETIKFVW